MSEKNANLKALHLWDADYMTTFTKKFEERKPYEAADPLKSLSFIPGTIQEIKIKEGQKVKKGEPMLLLESMKMLNLVKVPIDGKVKKIHIKIGERIPKNHLMVEFE
jgi:biotin carboxyl carrier protein